MKLSVSLIVLRYLRLSYALYGNFFLEKDDFFHELFQAGACPNLKDSSIYEFFLLICTSIEFGIFDFFRLSATP